MTGLLIHERFVAVLPSLVGALGSLESAVILQLLHFHAEDSMVRITSQQIAEETGIAERTVRRRLQSLRENNLISNEGRATAFDPTLTFQINYDHPLLSTRGGQSDRESGQNGRHSSIKNEKNSSSNPEGFDEWWAAYPKKVGKTAARKAYAKAHQSTDQDTLLRGLLAQRDGLAAAKARGFCPDPATWLNAGRWDDEVPGEDDPPETMSDMLRRYQ